MRSVTLYTNEPSTRQLLIYIYDMNPWLPGEVCQNQNTGTFKFVDWENTCDVTFVAVGPTGTFRPIIKDSGHSPEVFLAIDVSPFITDGESQYLLSNRSFKDNDFIRQVVLMPAREGALSEEYIAGLLKRARTHVEGRVRKALAQNTTTIKKYIYNAEDMYWELMNSSRCRSIDSVFLPGDTKEYLFKYVKHFFAPDTRAEYDRYNVPYKSNILLYGRPGAGKTSTIMAVASHLNMNIGLIPISKGLDDTGLVHAMNSSKNNDCRILVIEDVDCLFTDRKAHDTAKNSVTLSGLLNCLDGLYRNEGVIVFLTANNVSFIDDAVLRSNRIDHKVHYDWATKDQVEKCYRFYFPDKPPEDFKRFYNHIKNKEITISMLQAFFFRHRKAPDIMDILADLDQIILGIKEEDKNTVVMYS